VTTLEMYATVARCKYVESGQYVLAEFKDMSKRHRELIQRVSAGTTSPSLDSNEIKEQLLVVEMQLTWMVYIIGALIGGRIVSLCPRINLHVPPCAYEQWISERLDF